MVSRRLLLALVAIVLVGGALRVEAATSPAAYQSADERAYAGLARGIALRGEYDSLYMAEALRWPPGAPMLFAGAIAALPGDVGDDRGDVPQAYVAQALVSTALIPVVALLALLAGGPLAAVLAALAVALYPPLADGPADLLSEPLGALLLAGACLAALLALRRPSRAWPVLAGLLLAGTVLTRADLLLVPLVVAGVVAVLGRRRRALLVLAVCGVGVLPWAAFASRGAGRPVPVTTGGASNLFLGTYLPGEGTLAGARRALGPEVRARLGGRPGAREARPRQAVVLDAVAARRPALGRDAALRAAAVGNLRRYPVREPLAYAGMTATKVERLWLDYSAGGAGARRPAVTALHLVLLALAAGGLLAGLLSRGGREPLLLLAAGLALYVTAVNAVLVSEPRHALTVLPVLLAAGAAGAARAVRHRRRPVSHTVTGAHASPLTPPTSPKAP